jgi:hypothetical protein
MPQSDELIERACFAWLRTLFPKRASDEEVRSRITDLDREHVGIIINAIKPALQPIDGEVERLARIVANAKIGEEIREPMRCEGPTDFEVNLARKWVKRVLSALNRDRLS